MTTHKANSNFEYLQSLPIGLFHAVMCGFMGIKTSDIEREHALMDWLKSDVDEGFKAGGESDA